MKIPRFYAENSFYKKGRQYQTNTNAINLSAQMRRAIYPASEEDSWPTYGNEVIVLEGKAPIEGEDMWRWWGGMGGTPGDIPIPEPEGGGGGGFPVNENGGGTEKMDKACDKAGVGCFPSLTTVTRCAVWRCRKDYCNDHECTSDEKVQSKEHETLYKGGSCDMYPCGDKTKRTFSPEVMTLW